MVHVPLLPLCRNNAKFLLLIILCIKLCKKFQGYFFVMQYLIREVGPSYLPGAYCIKLLPEKNSGYVNRSFFSHGKVSGKNHANLSFQILPEFFSGIGLCNGPQISFHICGNVLS